MDPMPSEPTSAGQGYRAADEAIDDGLNRVEWLEAALRRVAEELERRAS
jgi:hypothetical protein